MRLYRVRTDSGPRSAVARDGELFALDGCPVDEPDVEAAARQIAAGGRDAPALGPLEGARLVAPWTPRQIVAIGLNYHDHIRETGMETPERQLIFAKFPSSVIGPEAEIVADAALTEAVDWEVELSVVVGRTMRNVPEARRARPRARLHRRQRRLGPRRAVLRRPVGAGEEL